MDWPSALAERKGGEEKKAFLSPAGQSDEFSSLKAERLAVLSGGGGKLQACLLHVRREKTPNKSANFTFSRPIYVCLLACKYICIFCLSECLGVALCVRRRVNRFVLARSRRWLPERATQEVSQARPPYNAARFAATGSTCWCKQEEAEVPTPPSHPHRTVYLFL